jgi:hypothetical protein
VVVDEKSIRGSIEMNKTLLTLLVVAIAFAGWATHRAYSETLIKLTDEAVMFEGDFKQGSSKRLKFYVTSNPKTKTVVFSSMGGLFGEGLEVGYILDDNKMTAQVMEGDKCVSACAFAFLGAHKQYMSGTIAFHEAWADYGTKTKETLFSQGQDIGGYTLYYVMKMGYSSQLAYFIQAKTNQTTFLVFTSPKDLNVFLVSKATDKTPLKDYNNWPVKDQSWLKTHIKKSGEF